MTQERIANPGRIAANKSKFPGNHFDPRGFPSKQQLTLFPANGVELYVEEEGNGEPVVFVHGSLGDYRDWRNQFGFFSSQGYRAFTYSRRNHFPNPWSEYPNDYSLLYERNDLLAVLSRLNNPVYLVGHSYGAYVVALVARDQPRSVKKIVLAEPPIFTMLQENEAIGNLDARFFRTKIDQAKSFLREGETEKGIAKFLEGLSGATDAYSRLEPSFRKSLLENSKTALSEIEISPERDPFYCADASKISCPALLLQGESSPMVLHAVISELSKCIPKSKVKTLPRSSHGMIWDNFRDFNNVVLNFIREKD